MACVGGHTLLRVFLDESGRIAIFCGAGC